MDIKLDIDASQTVSYLVLFAMSVAVTWKTYRDEDRKIKALVDGLSSLKADELTVFINKLIVCFSTKSAWAGVTICFFCLAIGSFIEAIYKAITANF